MGHPQEGRSKGIPGLSEAQAEALDAVELNASVHAIAVSTQEGDIRFVNNMGILHGRQGFHDDDKDAKSRRHLMRLWLRNQEMAWEQPPALQLASARIFDDTKRGVHWDVEPVVGNGIHFGRFQPPNCD